MYNFPENKEWKNKELYFTSIQRAVKYYNDFKENYECAGIGEILEIIAGKKREKTKRIYYERIIVETGKIKIRDNRNLYKLKTLEKIKM